MGRDWVFVDGASDWALWKVWSLEEGMESPPIVAVYAYDVHRALEIGRQVYERVPRGLQGYVHIYASSPKKVRTPFVLLRHISMYAVRLITTEEAPLTYEQFLAWHAQHMKEVSDR